MSDKIHNYLKSNFTSDLQKLIGRYERFASIDSFFNKSQYPEWFYEWSIQGMIYQLLVQFLGGRVDKYLLLLEQPYSPTDVNTRSDIMYINIESDDPHEQTVHALELKTNFKPESALADARKLVNELEAGNIATGAAVFFTPPDQGAHWAEEIAKQDAEVKDAVRHKLLLLIPVEWQT